MRSKLLLFAVATLTAVSFVGATAKGNSKSLAGKGGAELLGRSGGFEGNAPASYPQPFVNTGVNARTNAAISTGYYVVKNGDPTGTPWSEDYTFDPLSNTSNGQWLRVITGPFQYRRLFGSVDANSRYTNSLGQPTSEGKNYFRNPFNFNVTPGQELDTLPNGTPARVYDSTDNAFAGPIPIGFPFYFNGVRYDSFYVSSNGVVAFSNRRYIYGLDGRRVQLDPNSDDTRNRANPLDTTTPDNWGYQIIALNNNLANATAGLRSPNVASGGLQAPNNMNAATPMVAAFWGPLKLGVSNDDNPDNDPSGVYYKRYTVNDAQGFDDRLVIYLKQFYPETTTLGANGLPTSNAQTGYGSAQIILSRRDSSVVVHYDFNGTAQIAPPLQNPQLEGHLWFRRFTTMGVRGNMRTPNAAHPGYLQFTEYTVGNRTAGQAGDASVRVNQGLIGGPATEGTMALKYKQWKNLARVINFRYNIFRDDGSEETLSFAESANWELLAGDPILGGIRPTVFIQNLSNDYQGANGVNYLEQGANFRVRFRIRNALYVDPDNSERDSIVYSRTVRLDDATLTNRLTSTVDGLLGVSEFGDSIFVVVPTVSPTGVVTYNRAPAAQKATFVQNGGMVPYCYLEIKMGVYYPNEFRDKIDTVTNSQGIRQEVRTNTEVGRFIANAFIEPVTPDGASLGDQWPFDDSLNNRLNIVRVVNSFNTDGSDYSLSIRGEVFPSVLKWVSYGASLVDGDVNTFNPPGPNGLFRGSPIAQGEVLNPVLRLNRVDDDNGGVEHPSPGGDTLVSFPIDLRGKRGAVLSFSVQRAGKPTGYNATTWPDRLWAGENNAAELFGPEPRVHHLAGGTVTTPPTDSVFLEFANPSKIKNKGLITNNRGNWNRYFLTNPDGTRREVQNLRALAILGGGGYTRGFSVADKNLPAADVATESFGRIIDPFDDGKDQNFTKYFIPIPDYYFEDVDASQFFRFRFRLRAVNSTSTVAADDNDDFYVDNVYLWSPSEQALEGDFNRPDLEVSSFVAKWPYQVAPASQATEVPLAVKVSNNSNVASPSFAVAGIIARGQLNVPNPNIVYARSVTLPFMPPMSEIEVPMPNWNARTGDGLHNMQAYIIADRPTVNTSKPNDIYVSNDTVKTSFTLTFGDSYAYDPATAENDIPVESQRNGQGLNLFGTETGGFDGSVDLDGNGSGQIAIRFTVTTQDTLKGFQAYFGNLNQDFLNIAFNVYRHTEGTDVPQAEIPGTRIFRRRGIGVNTVTGAADTAFNRYTTYLLDQPIILTPGKYWISVAQLGSEGFQLGGSAARVGMAVTAVQPPPNAGPQPGVGDYHMMIFKPYRRVAADGSLENDNIFAFQNTAFTGGWTQFMKTRAGRPAYPYAVPGWPAAENGRGHTGGLAKAQGTWVPMLRPYFGVRPTISSPVSIDQGLLDSFLPVELVDFNGTERNGGVQLYWQTSSEVNNNGFNVERRLAGSADEWATLGFVKGAGNTTSPKNYDYFDGAVVPGTTYEYRLRQVDFDGTESFSAIVEVAITAGGAALEQNYPNPFNDNTTISFTVPARADVKFEIVNSLGAVVRTLVNETMDATRKTVSWDARDTSGQKVASGVYFAKLTVGDQVFVRQLNVVK